MNRNSASESDASTVATVGYRVGADGVDLRERQQPPALTKLINARFLDEKTISRRSGHTATKVQDKSSFPIATTGSSQAPGSWVYGHGIKADFTNSGLYSEGAHWPVAGRGGQVIDDNGSVWTGDRVITAGGYGSSPVFYRSTPGATSTVSYGIPAYCPTMIDTPLAASVDGRQHAATCLSADYRFVVYQVSTKLYATVQTRAGALVSTTTLNTTGTSPLDAEVFLSAGIPTVVWRDGGTGDSYYSTFSSSSGWTAQTVLVSSVAAFHIVSNAIGTGWHFFHRVGSAIKVAYYVGMNTSGVPAAQSAPLAGSVTLDLNATVPNGKIAADVAVDGSFTVAWMVGASVYVRMYKSSGANLSTAYSWTLGSAAYGISVGMYGLKNSNGYYDAVVHGSDTKLTTLWMAWNGSSVSANTNTRQNCRLASHIFRVGNELFAWCQSSCSTYSTNFLLSGPGSTMSTVAGYSERSEAVQTADSFGNYTIVRVLPDPLNAYSYSFIRARTTTYQRAGSCKVGDLNFLPSMTVAKYGLTSYLSGCAVRNWDGEKLLEAGFYDVVTATGTPSTTGGYIPAGTYSIRAYLVRYNRAGERFQSQAITSATVTTTGTTSSIAWAIKTCPSMTDTDGAFIEVYRNTSNDTAFRLEGTIANSMTSATVTFTSTMADNSLSAQSSDPFLPLTGQLSNWGPLGCEILATVGDRMWSAGGQVPAGQVQFSKLFTSGFGLSHNDLTYADIIDTEGGKITSIGAINDSVVAFQKSRVFVQQGTGPDNYGRGDWPPARAVSAPGATCHTGTIVVPSGLLFWSSSGPQLFTTNYQVVNISPEVRPLAETLTPTAVRLNAPRMEVVWYTASGSALLWNYMTQDSRWAVWSGLTVAGGNQDYLVTPDGYLMVEGGTSDNGVPFEFAFATGHLRGEDLLAGYVLLRSVGIVGMYEGSHQLRCKISYNESPVFTDSWIWDPTTNTWLTPGTTEASLTPAQIDAAAWYDKSGQYMVHKRVSRQNCSYFQVEFSDGGATNATFIPFEISFEIGVRPGLGRVATATFTQ